MKYLTAYRRYFSVHSLMLLAVFLRALIPVGYMPSAQASNAVFPLVVCSAEMGEKTVYLPASQLPGGIQESQKNDTHKDPRHAEKPCPFALASVHGSFGFAPPLHVIDWRGVVPLPAHVERLTAKAPLKSYFSQGPPSVLLHA